MIDTNEAKNLVNKNTPLLESCVMQLYDATGYILSQDILSPIDVPSFNQSAMDGYGFMFSDSNTNSLLITGEIPAGVFSEAKLLPNTAVRIFTGAAVPEGCDTVVMQEKVTVSKNNLTINDHQLKQGMNIRLQGAQTRKGSLAMKAGSKISPGVAGFLAGLGIHQVSVFRSPQVSIVNTGKELTLPGQPLDAGKIYESNSYSVNAALSELRIKPKTIESVDDDERGITDAIRKNLSACDVLIVSGGVSVGDYDFVAKAFDNCAVQCIFHNVKQKPGKPLYFGKYNNTLVFGLPGNPAAVLTCYYEYIVPALKKMMGDETENGNKLFLPLSVSFSKKKGLTYFLKGKLSGNEVIPMHAQESFQMSSFAFADCLIQLDENQTEFQKGDVVEVHLLNK